MAYWSLTTYSRADKSKEWWLQNTVEEIKSQTDLGSIITELENTGKITHYSISESNDGLKQYIKLGFDSKESFDKLITDIQNNPSINENKSTYLAENGLTTTVVNQESEPTITL